MGIQGLYGEIGSGQRIALVKYSLDHELQKNRRLRVAIDASIWSFQVQAGQGGNNPHLRTLYYRLVRLLSHNITPLFVFDGPNRPSFKRGRRTNTFLTPSFIRTCKKLLKLFGFPHHTAPGEAEAECAALQQAGVVDVVMSEDVDTLMFGASSIIRKWSPENKKSKVPTHVTVYDAASIKDEYRLDRHGIVLVALMHGGDYHPGGISGCGIQTAIRAAQAGFGGELCDLVESMDMDGIRKWRERLQHEITTNASRHFKTKNSKIKIPEDWPDLEVFTSYNNPLISNPETICRLARAIDWDATVEVVGLREYTRVNFEWRGTIGASKFVRTIAPALVSRWLLDGTNNVYSVLEGMHGRREHFTTDGTREVRVSYTPVNVVPIDRHLEEEDDALEAAEQQGVLEEDEPTEDRASDWNPEKPERIWVLESHVDRMAHVWVANPKMQTAAPKSKAAPKPSVQSASSSIISEPRIPPPEPPTKPKTKPKAKVSKPTKGSSIPPQLPITRRGMAILKDIASQQPRDPSTSQPSQPLSESTPTISIPTQRAMRSVRDESPTAAIQRSLAAIDLTSSPEPYRATGPTLQKSKLAARPGDVVERVKEKEKIRVILRESLPGSWKVVGEAEVALSDAKKTWEVVDILDLTGDE